MDNNKNSGNEKPKYDPENDPTIGEVLNEEFGKDNFIVDRLNGKGFVDIIFDPLLIGKGEYIISTAIFKSLNLFDAIEPEAYDLHDRKYKLKIEQPFGINTELGIINHPIRWNVRYVKW